MVEDDPIDAEHLTRLLRRICPAGEAVSVCGDVSSFERTMADRHDAQHRHPRVILTDLGLPDAQGIEVVKRVKAAAGDVPVIVLTGNTDPFVAEQAMAHGAQDFLVKGSFDLDALQRSIRYSMIRAHSEAELRATTRELQVINADLDGFAGVVAHDLRAPVRTARLLADRLVLSIGGPDADERVPDLAARLEGCLARLEDLIGGVLNQVTLRDTRLALEPVSIRQLVDCVRVDLSADLEATGSVLLCDDHTLAMADMTMFRKVLVNLVQNSIKYRDPSKPNVIVVTAHRRADQVVVRVIDNGIGIAPQYRTQIFSMFERLHNDAAIPGLGLGLAMCSTVMGMHGGTIAAVDPDGTDGTVIEMVLSAPGRRTSSSEPAMVAAVEPAPQLVAAHS